MKRWLKALNLVVAIALLGIVIAVYRPWEVWTLDAGFIGALAIALVLDALLVLVWATRHSVVLREVGIEIPAKKLLWLVTFSDTANNLAPAATGEIARAWLLRRNFGVPVEQSAAAIVFERVFMFGLMALSALAFGLVAAGSPAWLSWLGMAAVLAYVFLSPPIAAALAQPLGSRSGEGFWARILAVLASAFTVWSRRRATVLMAVLTSGVFLVMAVVFVLAAGVAGLDLDPFQAWALIGGATAAGVVSALPFGLGAAELSAVGIGALLGLDVKAVAAAFVIYRILFTLPFALTGSVAYGRLMIAEEASSE